MTDLSLDLKNSIADLQTRHAALITAVQQYRNGSVGVSKAEIIAAAAALEDRLNTEESTLLGLAGRGVQPSLSLDFMKDMYLAGDVRLKKGYNLTDLVTVRRDTAGSSFNSAGVMVQNAINVPRFDYDPVTKVLKGLLIEESRTNQATYSDSIDRWSKTQVIVVPNAAVAPDGTLNAIKLVNSTAASWHILQSTGLSITSGWVYTLSVYAKAAEYPRVRIGFNNTTVFSGQSVFDLTTGTRVSGSVGTITSVGNGWYRVTFTATAAQAGSVPFAINAVKAGETEAQTAGDGVSGIYIWGAQCEAGGMETSYIPTPTGFSGRSSAATYLDASAGMQSVASGVARGNAYGYDSTGALKPIGLLTEAAATNLCVRSNEFTSVSWTRAAGLAFSTDGTLAPNGTLATKVVVSGTVSHEMSCAVAALTVGQTYTLSLWVKPIGATVPNFALSYYDNSLALNSSALPGVQVVGEWRRYSFTFTPASTASVPRIRLIGYTGGLDGSQFYMFNCQLEVGSFATSDIITAASEGTRAADTTTSSQVARTPDVVTVNTGAWFNAREGTLTAEFSQRTSPITGTFRRIASLVGPNLDEISMYMSGAAGMVNSFVRGIGAVQNDAPAPGALGLAVDEVRRAAVAYKENDLSFSTLGLSSTDVTVILPTSVNSLVIGGNGQNLQRWCGHIRSVRYYPKRLTTAQIKILSA